VNFKSKITPAVTSVLLCTSALTGVGALMAFGSHLLKGNCALFVKELTKKKKKKKKKKKTPKKFT
jgi:hypothetical protein